ncbi:cytochrome o ubiquinol oxidase subunit III [Phenylobacterium sp.]|uniref:cytochrome o ubiquinol oxidase subunit III n=1 Tax=Phenylobacterium sp. TaxID=1871053 RepID=UPI0011F9678C|nr:cytochrome o ubiquinol oxidase subunit III [Phenylobacterium sp.]THD63852.1 MAG: cytochrome o ubiquinol oxidase subunit III [Phenylobacterium sp.]
MTTLDASRLPFADPPHDRAADRLGATGFGFYVYLLSDAILFASLFAAFAVLHRATAGGPTGPEVFKLPGVLLETACLLVSSFTCGLAMIAANAGRKLALTGFLAITFALGAAFLGLEVSEFTRMIAEGAGPDRSAFLSGFFTLVGAHGLHITVGLAWILILFGQLWRDGFGPGFSRRIFCFSLFWHVLDVVWIAIFTFVYLIGSQP